MNTQTRRAVAFIAGSLVAEARRTSVYDYAASRYTSFSGRVGDRVQIYDYDAQCHVGGSLLSLYHYGQNSHIQLKLSGNRFTGFDYGTSSHFNGTVHGRSVVLYDYGESAYFNYTV